jgi:hypothetical protein
MGLISYVKREEVLASVRIVQLSEAASGRSFCARRAVFCCSDSGFCAFACRTGNKRRYVDRNTVRTTRKNHGTKADKNSVFSHVSHVSVILL